MRKRRCESRQAGIGKANASEPLLKRRNVIDGIRTGVLITIPGGAWRRARIAGQAVSGVKVARARSAACMRNVGRRALILRPARERDARGSTPSRRNGEALSTVAVRAGGPARSSGEARVMRGERRGRLICDLFARATGACALGGDE